MVPSDRKYMDSHEWAKADGDVVLVGITAYAVEHLSDLTFLDLPEVGTDLEQGERFGEIESVKAVSELFSPVTGEVIEVNTALADDVAQLKDDAWDSGWMIKLRAKDVGQLDSLKDGPEYEKMVAEEQ